MNDPDIPAIDMSALWSHDAGARRRVAPEIGRRCDAIGFLSVSGHGIPRHVTQTAVDATRRFFAQDAATKLKSLRPSGIYRGYIPVMPFGEQRDPRVPKPLYGAFFAGDEKVVNNPGTGPDPGSTPPTYGPTPRRTSVTPSSPTSITSRR